MGNRAAFISGLLVSLGVATSAVAADLPVVRKAPVKAPPVVDYFAGGYVGAGIGGRSTRCYDVRTTQLLSAGIAALDPILGTPTACLSSSFRGSIYGGWNWRLAPSWIVGFEADVGYADDEGSVSPIPGTGFLFTVGGLNPAQDRFTLKKDWDGSIRGRVGYNVMPKLLAYGTGGFAWQKVEASMVCSVLGGCAAVGATVTASASDTMTGWTAGGGLEWALFDNVLLRGDYRYSDYGTFTNTLGTNTATSIALTNEIRMRTHTYTFGAAWRFATR